MRLSPENWTHGRTFRAQNARPRPVLTELGVTMEDKLTIASLRWPPYQCLFVAPASAALPTSAGRSNAAVAPSTTASSSGPIASRVVAPSDGAARAATSRRRGSIPPPNASKRWHAV
jgi:hypothetical protein